MLTFMSGICPRGPDLGHPKWWGRRRWEKGKWGNFLFRWDQGVGRGSKRRYLGKGSPTTNRYFCVSKPPQSPTETKPERKTHKLTKWRFSDSGHAAAAVEVVVVEEEQGRVVKTGEALFGWDSEVDPYQESSPTLHCTLSEVDQFTVWRLAVASLSVDRQAGRKGGRHKREEENKEKKILSHETTPKKKKNSDEIRSKFYDPSGKTGITQQQHQRTGYW